MNCYQLIKILIIVIIFILLFILLYKINNNKLLKVEKINKMILSQPYCGRDVCDEFSHLYMTEEDFNKLDINTRWYYRAYCLNYFDKIKDNYHLMNFKHPPKSEANNLIFVNLASYRDPECYKTIQSLINNSSNWKNLRIVVCEQNSIEDIPYNYNLNNIYNSIIRVIKMNYLDARGPTRARYLIQQLYNKEEYYLQIDSHTRFEKHWDLKLINSIKNLPDKSCLTQYLPDYPLSGDEITIKLRDSLNVNQINAMDGFSRIGSSYIDSDKVYDKPFSANGWSGCFSFSKGDICHDAPIDPYTPDVFFGEEMDMALRLFTRGWNFYSPHYPIAYTNFDRSYRDTFWQKKGAGYDKNITLSSRLRIHYRLGTLPYLLKSKIENDYPELIINHNLFTLGNERNLKDYEKLIGFNFKTEKTR
tara:strand:+ start:2360 stop:3613 length:1254 start_codon:yes stop_codon:yes gene_type:complete